MKKIIDKKWRFIRNLLVASLFVSPCYTNSASSADTQVPEELKVPAGQTLMLEARGVGVQVYKCMADRNDATEFKWVFQRPEADLLNSADKKVGKHYAGPTWESEDGSKVTGEIVRAYNSPESNSIPWLLIRAKTNSGAGVFSRITYIQRLNTFGGKAPSEGCSKEQLDSEIRVPYKAEYYFYIPMP